MLTKPVVYGDARGFGESVEPTASERDASAPLLRDVADRLPFECRP